MKYIVFSILMLSACTQETEVDRCHKDHGNMRVKHYHEYSNGKLVEVYGPVCVLAQPISRHQP